MERPATLAKVMGNDVVDQGLGAAAVHHRFPHEDLVSILTNTTTGQPPGTMGTARHNLTDRGQLFSHGTGGWANFGTTTSESGDSADLEGATE